MTIEPGEKLFQFASLTNKLTGACVRLNGG